ncbi:MAG TPA: phosphoribosyl-AMP cyclohydrolase [Aeromonadales bacterium]|nr:phosphoribosyl-AMP cyclohydrolase [Aeromonadales bacterium]
MIIPSIDIFDGQAVQWRQGKEPVIARDDIFELLEEFSLYGEVAIIDLNAATGKGDNESLILKLLKKKSCRVGGGIRTLEIAQNYIKAGASKIILATAATEDWVKNIAPENLIFAIDANGDEWLTHGWQKGTGKKVLDILPELEKNCSEFLYTQVAKEGMLQGIDKDRIQQILEKSSLPVTVAGGITTTDDICWLQRRGANAQIGMAIYTGKIQLNDAFIDCVDFEKSVLIPTIVQDFKSKDILMLAYSNKISLTAALTERKGIYWSRSRDQLWRKGDTSGHSQQLINVDMDCDADTLIFQVNQTGKACHLHRWSCFPSQSKRFNLASLDEVFQQRLDNPQQNSYTSQLFESRDFQAEKLREETEELIETDSFYEARWEASDLLFFTLIAAKSRGVSISDIVNELRSRHK